jgi:hypothetical protein
VSPVTPNRFDAAKRHIAALLDKDPDTTVDEARERLADYAYPWDQLQRAWVAVKRARAQPELDAMKGTLHRAGIDIPPAAGAFVPVAPAPRTYPSDDTYPTDAFIDAYAMLAAAYEHTVKNTTRDVYYKQLVREEGCTVEECVAAVPLMLRSEGVWPRIAVWLKAVHTVRYQRERRNAGAIKEPTVDGEGNAVWACTICRDTGWRPECGCTVEEISRPPAGVRSANGRLLVPGYCYKHPRVENGGIEYRPRFVRCECQQKKGAAS